MASYILRKRLLQELPQLSPNSPQTVPQQSPNSPQLISEVLVIFVGILQRDHHFQHRHGRLMVMALFLIENGLDGQKL